MSFTRRAVMFGLLVSRVAAARVESPIKFTDVLFDIKEKLGQATDVLLDMQEKLRQAGPQAGHAVPSDSPWAKSVTQLFKAADGALERVVKAHTAAEMSKLESLNAQKKLGKTEPQFNNEELKTAREKVRNGIETAAARVDDALNLLAAVREEPPDIMKKEVQTLIDITGAAKTELAELVTELDGDGDPVGSAAATSTTNFDVDAASQTASGALDSVTHAKLLAERLYFDDHVQDAKVVKRLLGRPEQLLSSVDMKFIEVILEGNKLLFATMKEMSDEERKNFKAETDKERTAAIDAAQKLAEQALTELDNCKLEAEKLGNTAITRWVGSAQQGVKELLEEF